MDFLPSVQSIEGDGPLVDKVAEIDSCPLVLCHLINRLRREGETLARLTRAADEADPAQLIGRMAVQRIIRDALLDLSDAVTLVISLRRDSTQTNL